MRKMCVKCNNIHLSECIMDESPELPKGKPTNMKNKLRQLSRIIEHKTQLAKKNAQEDIERVSAVIREYARKRKLLLYGGLAINSILPKKRRFYNNEEYHDFDFFSYKAKVDAIDLAKTLKKNGFPYVEVKVGFHYATYKVYVNFTSVADITEIPHRLFKRMHAMAQEQKPYIRNYAPDCDIHIVPLEYLRLALHIELSRPEGYIERWIKIYKRMTLLYDHYPVPYETPCNYLIPDPHQRVQDLKKELISAVKAQNLPILGVEAIKQYLAKGDVEVLQNGILDTNVSLFDVIATNYNDSITSMKNALKSHLQPGESLIIDKHAPLNKSELLPRHKMLSIVFKKGEKVIKRPLVCVYKSEACYAYKIIDGNRYASIDTILSFLYAWLLTDRVYLSSKRNKCILSLLLHIQYENLESQKSMFQLFEQRCYGKQLTLDEMRKKMWLKGSDKLVYKPSRVKNQ